MSNKLDNKIINFEGQDEKDLELNESSQESEDLSRQFNKFQLLELVENYETADVADSNNSEEDVDQKKIINFSISKHKQRKRRNRGKLVKSVKDDSSNSTEPLINEKDKLIKKNEPFKTTDSHFQLLKLDMRNLIPENELKRMFGKNVLKEEKSREHKPRHHFHSGLTGFQRSRFVSSGYHDTKNMQLSPGPKMELDDLFNIKQQFLDLQDTSKKSALNDNSKKKKKSTRPSTIVSTSSVDQPTYYKFVHDNSYQWAHNIFLEATHRGESERIIQNLGTYPTHVESLIQLSDMIRLSEDYKSASELIERALLIFERGFHPKFSLAQPNCRLSYKRPENRTFFITIFKHIAYCNRRGLRRTPLEYTKLLLSLDPENDPLFATLLIDFYSIRSEDYDYLIEFSSKWQYLSKLPNINFSLALAHFMKSRSMKCGKIASENSLKLADECLQQALLRYPNFIIPLLDACLAEPDSELKKCDYFDYTVYSNKYKTVPESVELLISLYVQRNNILWKSKHVLKWLEGNIAKLVKKFATKELVDEGQQIEYWSSFQGPSPRNLLRHVVLSELKVKIPLSAANSTVLDIDPYPPESIVSYNTENAPNNIGFSLTSQGISSLFVRSILPSFSMPEQSSNRQAAPSNNQINTGQTVDHERDSNNQAEQQIVDDEETARSLDRVQNSIQNVLSSLTNLLMGVENRPDSDDQQENN